MDKGSAEARNQRWKWLPSQMPGVAKLLAEKRVELGDAWVNECWRNGVLRLQPGWFFAAEGALMVGVLWDNPLIMAFASLRLTDTQSLLILKDKEGSNGA